MTENEFVESRGEAGFMFTDSSRQRRLTLSHIRLKIRIPCGRMQGRGCYRLSEVWGCVFRQKYNWRSAGPEGGVAFVFYSIRCTHRGMDT